MPLVSALAGASGARVNAGDGSESPRSPVPGGSVVTSGAPTSEDLDWDKSANFTAVTALSDCLEALGKAVKVLHRLTRKMTAGDVSASHSETKEPDTAAEGEGGSKEPDAGDEVSMFDGIAHGASADEVTAADDAVRKLRVRLQALMRGIAEGCEPAHSLSSSRINLELGVPLDVKDLQGRIMWRPAEIIGLKFENGGTIGMSAKCGQATSSSADEPEGAITQVLVHFNGWESNWDEWIDV